MHIVRGEAGPWSFSRPDPADQGLPRARRQAGPDMARSGDTPRYFDVALKLRVVEYYEKVRNKNAAAKMFGVSECSVRNWIKTEHRLRALSSQGRGGGARKTNRAAEAQALLETCMERYVQACQQRGVKAKYRDLLAHAAQLKKVHRVRGLKLSLEWVAQFVRERKLVGKCEKLTAIRKTEQQPAKPRTSPVAKGLSSVKSGSAKAAALKFLKRAKGQLSSVKARNKASTHKAKLPAKKQPAKAPRATSNDGKAIASKSKLIKKVGGKSSPVRKAPSSAKEKAVKKQKPKTTSAAGKAVVSLAKNKNAKTTAAGKKRASVKSGNKIALSKAKSAKSAAIIAKYKKSVLKKASQAQRKLKNKSTGSIKKKGQVQTKPKHKQQVAKKAVKLQKPNQSKEGPKAAQKVAAAKKHVMVKAKKQAKILNKVVSRSLKKAAKIVNRAKKPAGDANLPKKQPKQRVKQVPLKRLRPRKQPIKVFRTRYRIKEMHRRIEESRASDFFDFFYGLGLVPINRDSDNPLCIPLVTNSPKYYSNPGFICDVTQKDSPFMPGTSDLGCQSSSHSQLPSRFPIWTPVRTATGHDPSPSKSGKSRHVSPRVREEHIISDRFTQAESPEDSVFFEKLHKASMKSEGALSPGESPITPEQLAVVRKLFPPIGSLTFPTQRKVPLALDNQVSFNDPAPSKSLERKLRPRTSEQAKRLSLCFRKRRYQKRKRTLSEPSRSPERRPNGPTASDIDWLSADGFQSAAKRNCPSGSNSPVYSFCKEHFEDSACHGESSRNCSLGSGKHSGKDRLWGGCFDSAGPLGNVALPSSPTATSSGESKELFFGQALRLTTLRKKLDKNESVMHAAKGSL